MTWDRIRTQRDAEPIGHALSLLPSGIAYRLSHVRWVAGVDPVYAGLTPLADTACGRSYRSTAHVCWPYHLTHRPKVEQVTTVMLPVAEEPWVIVHELGHALHEMIDYEHVAAPVTSYAERDVWEAFAESFAAWVCPDVYACAQDSLLRDEATVRLFEQLDGGAQ